MVIRPLVLGLVTIQPLQLFLKYFILALPYLLYISSNSFNKCMWEKKTSPPKPSGGSDVKKSHYLFCRSHIPIHYPPPTNHYQRTESLYTTTNHCYNSLHTHTPVLSYAFNANGISLYYQLSVRENLAESPYGVAIQVFEIRCVTIYL